MTNRIILQGAYGRNYINPMQAYTDWYAGKDFKIEGGPYCSNRDEDMLRDMGQLWFRVGQGQLVVL